MHCKQLHHCLQLALVLGTAAHNCSTPTSAQVLCNRSVHIFQSVQFTATNLSGNVQQLMHRPERWRPRLVRSPLRAFQAKGGRHLFGSTALHAFSLSHCAQSASLRRKPCLPRQGFVLNQLTRKQRSAGLNSCRPMRRPPCRSRPPTGRSPAGSSASCTRTRSRRRP